MIGLVDDLMRGTSRVSRFAWLWCEMGIVSIVIGMSSCTSEVDGKRLCWINHVSHISSNFANQKMHIIYLFLVTGVESKDCLSQGGGCETTISTMRLQKQGQGRSIAVKSVVVIA